MDVFMTKYLFSSW